MFYRLAINEQGEPWWVAKDVAEALGYVLKTNLINHIPEDMEGGLNRLIPLAECR